MAIEIHRDINYFNIIRLGKKLSNISNNKYIHSHKKRNHLKCSALLVSEYDISKGWQGRCVQKGREYNCKCDHTF